MVDSRGITLTELLVAITVALVVTTVAWDFYRDFQRSVIFSSRFSENEQGAYRKVGMIVSQFRRASSVQTNGEGSCRLVTHSGDTIRFTIRHDTLFRATAGSTEKAWFPLDSLSISIPGDSGWVSAEIRGTYPGRFKTSHAVSQRVTVFLEPSHGTDHHWGF